MAIDTAFNVDERKYHAYLYTVHNPGGLNYTLEDLLTSCEYIWDRKFMMRTRPETTPQPATYPSHTLLEKNLQSSSLMITSTPVDIYGSHASLYMCIKIWLTLERFICVQNLLREIDAVHPEQLGSSFQDERLNCRPGLICLTYVPLSLKHWPLGEV